MNASRTGRREAVKGTTHELAPSLTNSGRGVERSGESRGQDPVIAVVHTLRADGLITSTGDISHCLNAGGMGRQDYETETVIVHTLRAMGQRQGGILRLFVCEGLLLGAAGAVLGSVLALLLAWLINHSGLSWTPPGYVYAYPLKVRVWGAWTMLASTAVGLAGVAGLSAWWPARRAAQRLIVDALRHV